MPTVSVLFQVLQKSGEDRRYPRGWDADPVNKGLVHYESQSEEKAVAEDEAAFEASGQTVMKIPTERVPAVREVIAKHRAA